MYPSKKFRGYVISKTACEGGFKKKSCPRGAKNQANAASFWPKTSNPEWFFCLFCPEETTCGTPFVARTPTRDNNRHHVTFFLIAKLWEKSGIRNTVPPGIAAPSTIAYPFKTFSTGYLIPGVSYFDPPFRRIKGKESRIPSERGIYEVVLNWGHVGSTAHSRIVGRKTDQRGNFLSFIFHTVLPFFHE